MSTPFCAARRLLGRVLAQRRRLSSQCSGDEQPLWINEHSSRILQEFEQRGEIEKRRSYEMLIEGVHHRQQLLLSYNIGVPVDVREKDMNKRAAKLVGLKMPDDPPSSPS